MEAFQAKEAFTQLHFKQREGVAALQQSDRFAWCVGKTFTSRMVVTGGAGGWCWIPGVGVGAEEFGEWGIQGQAGAADPVAFQWLGRGGAGADSY